MKIEFGNIVTLEYSNGRLPVLMLQAICLMAFDKTECFGHFRILISLFRFCIEIISDIYKWCRTCERRQNEHFVVQWFVHENIDLVVKMSVVIWYVSTNWVIFWATVKHENINKIYQNWRENRCCSEHAQFTWRRSATTTTTTERKRRDILLH